VELSPKAAHVRGTEAFNPLATLRLSFRSTSRRWLRRLIAGAWFEFFFDLVTYGFHWFIRCGPDGLSVSCSKGGKCLGILAGGFAELSC